MGFFLKKVYYFLASTWNRFWIDDCYSKASALSYYTLLSIVPMLAVVFGIGKGFGFDKLIEDQILDTFYQNPEFAQKIISFSLSALDNAKGGLIAGFGVLVLFWSAIGLLGSLETALNNIWRIPFSRSIGKKITDFLPIIIFGPIFIVAASSLTFMIISKVGELSTGYPELKPAISVAYFILLILLTWIFFSFLYIYMPNRKVPQKACIYASFFVALAFQALQWSFIHLQIYLTSYNAIYGSFAAIPLFLLWLQFSWILTLAGGEIAAQFAEKSQDFSRKANLISISERELMLLAVMLTCEGFLKRSPLSGSQSLADQIGIDRTLAEETLNHCYQARLLVESRDAGGNTLILPVTDPETLTIEEVEQAFAKTELKFFKIPTSPLLDKVNTALQNLEHAQKSLPSNLSIKDLLSI